MAHVPPEIHQLFRRQYGVASTTQLLDAGLTRSQLARLTRRGDLESMMRGVFRSPSVPDTELARCLAVVLAHPLVAVGGVTAGRLWGFRRMAHDRRVHVIAPRHWRATTEPWCAAYRTDAIHDDDVVTRPDGIRITTRQRSALDLARSIRDPDRLLSIVEQAAHDGGLRDGDLRAVAVDWRRGRSWVARYLRQVDRRLDGGGAESEPEVRVGAALAGAGVVGLVRQFPVDLPDYGRARFDLAVPEWRWAVEVDVFPTHRETLGRQRDERRDVAASRVGWSVRRISATDYRLRFRDVIADLAAEALGHCAAS